MARARDRQRAPRIGAAAFAKAVDVRFAAPFAKLFERSKWRFHGFKGGRGGGKSHAIATFLILLARHEPLRIVCCREFQNSIADSSKALLEDKIKELGLSDEFIITDRDICSIAGARFMFIGLDRNPDSSRSLEGADICFVEEAHRIKNASLKVLIPTVRKPGSFFIFAWNPKSPTDPIDAMMCGPNAPPRSYVEHVNYTDNPWIGKTELVEEAETERIRDPQAYKHIWLGEYQSLADAQIFKRYSIGRVPVSDAELPCYGLDFGFGSDPLAGLKVYVKHREKIIYIAGETYGHGIATEAMPAMVDRLIGSRHFPLICDSARPDTIDYLKRNGFPMARGAKKGPNSVMDGISWLQGFDIVIDPGCKHTAEEFKNYSWKVDRLTHEPLPVPEDSFNHMIDALRYCTEASRTDAGVTIRKIRF